MTDVNTAGRLVLEYTATCKYGLGMGVGPTAVALFYKQLYRILPCDRCPSYSNSFFDLSTNVRTRRHDRSVPVQNGRFHDFDRLNIGAWVGVRPADILFSWVLKEENMSSQVADNFY